MDAGQPSAVRGAVSLIYLSCAAGTKQELKELYDDRQIVQFAEFYPVGHR